MTIYYKISCLICKQQISKNNFNKHYSSNSCLHYNTLLPKSKGKCQYCLLDLKELSPANVSNHVRWCLENPKREYYLKTLKRNSKNSDESIEKMRLGVIKAHREGKYDYKDRSQKQILTKIKNNTLHHSEEAKKKMRKAALECNHQRKCKKSHEYVDKIGRKFIFDSSWEDAMADRLDELNMYWVRPQPIRYKDKLGVDRNYFADFYIPSLNLYIDPKNEWVIQQQKEKLDIIHSMINLIVLDSLDKCKNWQSMEGSNL